MCSLKDSCCVCSCSTRRCREPPPRCNSSRDDAPQLRHRRRRDSASAPLHARAAAAIQHSAGSMRAAPILPSSSCSAGVCRYRCSSARAQLWAQQHGMRLWNSCSARLLVLHCRSNSGGGASAGADSTSSSTCCRSSNRDADVSVVGSSSSSSSSRRPAVARPLDASVEEALLLSEESLHERAALCDSGLPDPDMCLIPEAEEEPPQALPVWEEAVTRGRWLLGLLVLQSSSSFVLDSYQDLLKDHIVVTLFLTMLVGAGGNAGNQSAIKVIRGLATGSITTSWASIRATLTEQVEVALLLGGGLSIAGFLRVYITNGSLINAAAISLSLLSIVVTSVLLGSGLPFALARAGVDPANAGTSIQVVMDVLGVAITCVTCQSLLVQYAGSVA